MSECASMCRQDRSGYFSPAGLDRAEADSVLAAHENRDFARGYHLARDFIDAAIDLGAIALGVERFERAHAVLRDVLAAEHFIEEFDLLAGIPNRARAFLGPAAVSNRGCKRRLDDHKARTLKGGELGVDGEVVVVAANDQRSHTQVLFGGLGRAL
jgi:hypothetical protein